MWRSDGFYRSFSEKEIIEEVNGIENFSIEEDVKRMFTSDRTFTGIIML